MPISFILHTILPSVRIVSGGWYYACTQSKDFALVMHAYSSVILYSVDTNRYYYHYYSLVITNRHVYGTRGVVYSWLFLQICNVFICVDMVYRGVWKKYMLCGFHCSSFQYINNITFLIISADSLHECGRGCNSIKLIVYHLLIFVQSLCHPYLLFVFAKAENITLSHWFL